MSKVGIKTQTDTAYVLCNLGICAISEFVQSRNLCNLKIVPSISQNPKTACQSQDCTSAIRKLFEPNQVGDSLR